jgi:hypothetical protein
VSPTKLNRFPSNAEMRRLRERWDREDAEDVPLKDFDTTLATGVDSTLNQLVNFKGRSGPSVERDNLRDQVANELKSEIVELRRVHAETVTTLNLKASKAAFIRFEAALATKVDKRIDNIYKLIGALGVVLGLLIALKR